jgi:hypothetical protein
MRLDRRHLRGHGSIEQMAATPARDQTQPMSFEDRPQYRGVAGELVAQLDPRKARVLRLGEAGFERDVAAQFRQIVVAPADRADAEAHGHRFAARPASSPGELSSGARGIATANRRLLSSRNKTGG